VDTDTKSYKVMHITTGGVDIEDIGFKAFEVVKDRDPQVFVRKLKKHGSISDSDLLQRAIEFTQKYKDSEYSVWHHASLNWLGTIGKAFRAAYRFIRCSGKKSKRKFFCSELLMQFLADCGLVNIPKGKEAKNSRPGEFKSKIEWLNPDIKYDDLTEITKPDFQTEFMQALKSVRKRRPTGGDPKSLKLHVDVSPKLLKMLGDDPKTPLLQSKHRPKNRSVHETD